MTGRQSDKPDNITPIGDRGANRLWGGDGDDTLGGGATGRSGGGGVPARRWYGLSCGSRIEVAGAADAGPEGASRLARDVGRRRA